jgi:transcriptional regulator with XRE-family HTH domain
MSRIREIRERLNLTQTELAVRLGCTQGNLGFIERGVQALVPKKAEMLIQVAGEKGLRLTFDQVYGRAPLPAQRSVRGHATAAPATGRPSAGGREQRGSA